jgi:4-amino-4-deoxy-L-arabinose transferase-like glycosyltransferase
MPVFQILCAPYFALFGQDANIMLPLRVAMLPLYAACLWCTYQLAALLFSKRAGWWCCLVAALIPAFYFPSTEFRTDNLWAVCWFLALIAAISARFTLKRAFVVGLLLGLTTAVSTKTVFLGAGLALAALFALGLRAWLGKERVPVKQILLALLAIVCGGIIVPGAVAIYFAAKGAFDIFFYCVFLHNVVPHLKRWGDISRLLWIFPLTLPFLAAYAVFIFRQAPTVELGTRRVLILLTPYLYAGLMFSYCPDLSRQDNLPCVPLLPMTLIPFLITLGRRWGGPSEPRVFFLCSSGCDPRGSGFYMAGARSARQWP